ncbi:hypothetical protein [Streptomyces sp. NPDC050988]|uniref:hypothetical protein n=1 Tax=Streptomyces sp. NPDC050988 TaxID=3365637 RepID=UPI0037A9E3F8
MTTHPPEAATSDLDLLIFSAFTEVISGEGRWSEQTAAPEYPWSWARFHEYRDSGRGRARGGEVPRALSSYGIRGSWNCAILDLGTEAASARP